MRLMLRWLALANAIMVLQKGIRMFRILIISALAAAAICGAQVAPQQTQPQPPSALPPQVTPKPPSPPAVPPDTASAVTAAQPVITVKGVCATPARKPAAGAPAKPAAAAPCTTIVTKAQFEKLLNAISPSSQAVAPAMRRNLAQAYVELLAYAQAATKAGVDKDPKFVEVLHLMRMRALADIYRRDLEEKYRTPPPTEIQSYYNQNLSRYEEIKLSRIFIPAKNTSAQNKDDWEKKAAQVANDIHDRAAKGEDLEKLQKEAYTTLGLTIAPPNTVVGTRRRGMLAPQEEQELFALKPGDVSKLEQEPAGYIIYKLESKQTLPLDQVKDEISRELFRQKFDGQVKAVTSGVQAEFNDQYFGPSTPPPPLPAPGGNRPPGGGAGTQSPSTPAPKPTTPPPSTPPPGQTPPPK